MQKLRNSYQVQVKLQRDGFCEGFSVKEATNKMKTKHRKDKRQRGENERCKKWINLHHDQCNSASLIFIQLNYLQKVSNVKFWMKMVSQKITVQNLYSMV